MNRELPLRGGAWQLGTMIPNPVACLRLLLVFSCTHSVLENVHSQRGVHPRCCAGVERVRE